MTEPGVKPSVPDAEVHFISYCDSQAEQVLRHTHGSIWEHRGTEPAYKFREGFPVWSPKLASQELAK